MKRYIRRERQDVHKDFVEYIRRQETSGILLKVQLYNSRLAPIAIFRFVGDDRVFVLPSTEAICVTFYSVHYLSQCEYYIRIYFILAFIAKFLLI